MEHVIRKKLIISPITTTIIIVMITTITMIIVMITISIVIIIVSITVVIIIITRLIITLINNSNSTHTSASIHFIHHRIKELIRRCCEVSSRVVCVHRHQ